jgi:hypothetical protein
LQTGACGAAFGFALQRNDSSGNSTSFREHFSHNGTFWNNAVNPRRKKYSNGLPWIETT